MNICNEKPLNYSLKGLKNKWELKRGFIYRKMGCICESGID